MDRQAATDCGGWRAAYWLWQIVYDPCDHVREVLPHIPTAARRSRSAPRRPLWACFIGYRPIHTASATAMTTAAMKIAVSTGAIVHIGSSDALFLRPRSLQLCALISVLIWIKPSSRYSPGPAIGTVRPQRQLFHQQGNVLSRNCNRAVPAPSHAAHSTFLGRLPPLEGHHRRRAAIVGRSPPAVAHWLSIANSWHEFACCAERPTLL